MRTAYIAQVLCLTPNAHESGDDRRERVRRRPPAVGGSFRITSLRGTDDRKHWLYTARRGRRCVCASLGATGNG